MHWKIYLCVSWFLAITSGLFAQTSPEDSLTQEYELEDVVVTAQYAPTHYKNALHSVRVIKGIDVQKQGLNNLAEVLSNQLNLRVNTDPILGNGLSIQGIGGENIQILIDGVPVIGRSNGNIDLSQININHIERIEIVEGAMSAQYGSNASGGVINIITKKSQIAPLEISSQNQYENIGIYNNSLRVGIQLGRIYASIEGARYESQLGSEEELREFETIELPSGESFRARVNPWNPKTQYNLNGKLRYQIADSIHITYQYRYFDEELKRYGEKRRPQFKPYAFDEAYHTIRQDHSLNLEAYLGKSLYLNSTTGYNQFDRINEDIRLDFETGESTIQSASSEDSSIFTALLHRSIISTLTDKKLNAQLGLEVLHETGEGGRIIDSTSAPFHEATLTNYAAWLGLQFRPIDKLTLAANLRYGYNTKYKHPLIPSFHLNWQAQKDLRFKLSYARGFRAPSLKELHFNFIDINHYIIGNPDVDAETSENASLDIQFNKSLLPKHKLTLSGKLFYNNIQDRIILAEFAQLQFSYQNIEEFKTHGLNLGLQYQIKDLIGIKLGFAHTRLFNIFSEEYDSDAYTGLDEWQNELFFQVPLLDTRLTFTHRYIGQQWRFFTDSNGGLDQGFIEAYHLINLSASQNFWKNRILLSLGIKNLLDTQNLASTVQGGGAHSGSGSSILLNWGRTYFVRLNVQFGLGR